MKPLPQSLQAYRDSSDPSITISDAQAAWILKWGEIVRRESYANVIRILADVLEELEDLQSPTEKKCCDMCVCDEGCPYFHKAHCAEPTCPCHRKEHEKKIDHAFRSQCMGRCSYCIKYPENACSVALDEFGERCGKTRKEHEEQN